MFFILSKLLLFLIQPLNWIVGLLFYSLFTKHQKRRKTSLWIATLLLLFFTNHFLFNQIVRLWEPTTALSTELKQRYDIGILLGGYSNHDIIRSADRHTFSERANRFTQALELYKKGKIKKLLLTGGSGSLLEDKPSEALRVKPFLLLMGVPDSAIILEPDARNTYENAVFSQRILAQGFPDASCLLITSAWHMPRAMGCFAKAGVSFQPYCVDYLSESTRFVPGSLLLPNNNTLYRWSLLIKEWVGYLVYWMKGYI